MATSVADSLPLNPSWSLTSLNPEEVNWVSPAAFVGLTASLLKEDSFLKFPLFYNL